jgi:hypothetical protein
MNNTGQICRSKKNAQSRYTMIDNAILQNWEMTPEEKSILIYLLSMPENWIVLKTKLIEDSNIGRDRFNRAWKALQEKGYIQSIRVINKDTRQITGWNHIVYEQPVLPETRVTEIPLVGDSESRDSRKSEIQSVYKEQIEQSNNLTKETERETEREEEQKKKPKKVFTRPTIDEIKEYFNAVGTKVDPDRFFNYYEASNWMRSKTQIQNWKACLKTWESRDKEEKKPIISKNVATLNDD